MHWVTGALRKTRWHLKPDLVHTTVFSHSASRAEDHVNDHIQFRLASLLWGVFRWRLWRHLSIGEEERIRPSTLHNVHTQDGAAVRTVCSSQLRTDVYRLWEETGEYLQRPGRREHGCDSNLPRRDATPLWEGGYCNPLDSTMETIGWGWSRSYLVVYSGFLNSCVEFLEQGISSILFF